MEGETGLINVVVSVGHSVSQPANAALRVLECVDLGLEAAGVNQATQDVVVDVAEP